MPSTTPLASLNFLGGVFAHIAALPAFFRSAGMLSFFNLLWAVCVILGATVVYVSYMFTQAEHKQVQKFKEVVLGSSAGSINKKRTTAWHDVAKLMASESGNDWKIAILEADSILDELLEDLGYVGENLGERLKSVPKGNMQNLEAAWSAHKVRNEIAHDVGAASLDKRKAIDTIANFERVFREFDYI